MKKRYCIFSAQYFPHLGGVERYTYNLSKKLIERGNEVIIVTSNTYHLAEYEKVEGVSIFRTPCYNLLDGRYPVTKFNKRFVKIYKMLKGIKIDMIIVNTRFYPHSLCGMVLARLKKVKCITIDHGTSHLSVNNKMWDSVGAVFEHVITKIGQLFCKEYYGVSEACNEWLAHFHIKAKGVLYNSINLEEIKKVQTVAAPFYREKYNIPDDAIVITFTGRLLSEKGLPSLLNVMDRLCKEREDIYLFIAGDGPMEKEIRRRKSGNIIPLGQIEFGQIVTLLGETDIFCLPSFSEGFSTSILEAAACNCYIVTTARGGARELMPDASYGSVIPNNEETTLYMELKTVLDDTKLREKAIKLTGGRLASCFTWDIAAEEVEKICLGN